LLEAFSDLESNSLPAPVLFIWNASFGRLLLFEPKGDNGFSFRERPIDALSSALGTRL